MSLYKHLAGTYGEGRQNSEKKDVNDKGVTSATLFDTKKSNGDEVGF